ncbi:MAG: hypothetical protein QG652_1148 [Pseudomonadota bacterium]|nr:hypothetical protein [Pseudomonadota bacterium]
MKKLLFKMILLTGLLLLVPYYMLGGGSLPDFLQGLLKPGKPAGAPMTNMSSVTTDKEMTLYKCTNESGQVEFSQSPCTGESETIHLQPNVNVVQRTKTADEEETGTDSNRVISLGNHSNETTNETELGNPYDPDNIQKLFRDAKNVGKTLEQHNKQVENISAQ